MTKMVTFRENKQDTIHITYVLAVCSCAGLRCPKGSQHKIAVVFNMYRHIPGVSYHYVVKYKDRFFFFFFFYPPADGEK